MRIVGSLRRWGVAIVAGHALVTVLHSAAHANLHIYMERWQNVYIFLVIILLPLLAGLFLWLRLKSGFPILLLSMLGSLIFGGYYHFVLSGADNVGSVDSQPWGLPFQLTAVFLAITELAGVIVGALGIRSDIQNRSV